MRGVWVETCDEHHGETGMQFTATPPLSGAQDRLCPVVQRPLRSITGACSPMSSAIHSMNTRSLALT